MKIRKAVIAAAGFGTRFLPQTKAMPKEMLPVIDKPIIQYVVEELVAAGVEDIIIVTGYPKRSIEDHFDLPSQDLRTNLERAGKEELLKETEKIANLANFIYVRQKGPLGNAVPLLNVSHLIGDEPFFYTWGDEFIISEPRQFVYMRELYEKYNASVTLTQQAKSDEDYKKYGFFGGESLTDKIVDANKIIEKPGIENAPSDRYSIGGFLLLPSIFGYVDQLAKDFDGNGELLVQKAFAEMLKNGERFVAADIDGTYYDTGNKLEYLKTVASFAANNPEFGEEFKDHIRTLIK